MPGDAKLQNYTEMEDIPTEVLFGGYNVTEEIDDESDLTGEWDTEDNEIDSTIQQLGDAIDDPIAVLKALDDKDHPQIRK